MFGANAFGWPYFGQAYAGTTGGGIANTLTASPATVVITGSSATLPVAHKPPLSPGSYAITGSPTTLPVARRLAVVPATYAITGSPTIPVVSRRLVASPGSMTISGASTVLVGPGPTRVDINVQRPYVSLWMHPF